MSAIDITPSADRIFGPKVITPRFLDVLSLPYAAALREAVAFDAAKDAVLRASLALNHELSAELDAARERLQRHLAEGEDRA